MKLFSAAYGVARTIYIPIIKRAAADFAVSADWTPVAGDVKISKDGAASANVTNLPTALTMGNTAVWAFSLTATEMQANQVIVTVGDAATKAVEDDAFVIETFGTAQGIVDLNGIADALLARDIGSGSGAGTLNERTVRSALRMLRNYNSVSSGTLTVRKEDDSTTAWTAAVTTNAGANPIVAIDPA
jgi:hypothetical protein